MKLFLSAVSALAFAGVAHAQTATPAVPGTAAAQAAAPIQYTDQQLRTFATATLRVNALREELKAVAPALTAEEQTAKLNAEIRTFGYSGGEEYNILADKLSRDPLMVPRVRALMAEIQTEQLRTRAEADARVRAEAAAAAKAQAAAQATAQAEVQAGADGQARAAAAEVTEEQAGVESATGKKKKFSRTTPVTTDSLRARMRSGQGRR